MEMKEKVLSSIGAQDVDTGDYHVDELDDIQFYWEDPEALIDAEFRSGIDTPYSPSHSDDVFGTVNNPILTDDEEDKENEDPTTPVSTQTEEPPRLQRSFGRPFQRLENISDRVFRNLFD